MELCTPSQSVEGKTTFQRQQKSWQRAWPTEAAVSKRRPSQAQSPPCTTPTPFSLPGSKSYSLPGSALCGCMSPLPRDGGR